MRSLLLLLTLSAAAFAQHHVHTWRGTLTGAQMGFAVAAADVDADGYSDPIVGAPGAFPNGGMIGRVRVFSGADGRLLKELSGQAADDQFGWSVAAAGDVDKDGHQDFLVGAPFEDSTATNSGTARLYSGKTFLPLFTWQGGAGNEILGISVNAAGDVDKDGWIDLVVGGHGGAANGPLSGVARVFSGKTGAEIFHHDGDSARDFLGHSVAAAGDVDKDGHADVIVGVPDDDDSGSNSGSARVLSGRTHAILFRWDGDATTHNFGHSVAGAGDVNGDGWVDLVVAAPRFNPPAIGYVRVFSGKDGTVIRTHVGAAVDDWFGEPVAAAGDWNRDGFADYLIGVHKSDVAATDAGLASVYSGKDGSLLASFRGRSAGANFGYALCMAGDVNKDGREDLIAGAPAEVFSGNALGAASVLSAVPLALTADVSELSLATGGTQVMSAFAGPAQSGKLYLFLGSASGVAPGVQFPNGPLLPLNYDDYLLVMLTMPNVVVQQSLGTLDAAGQATARFVLVKGLSAAFAGLRLHHAFLTIDLAKVKVETASNPVPLRLVL